MTFSIRGLAFAAIASASLLTAGCATETSYRPAKGTGFNRTGYSDLRLQPDRFQVTFSGNSVTSRDTVERYLLFRAAELTLREGYRYFVTADRNTDLQSKLDVTPGIGRGFGGFGGYWGPSWRYHGRGFGYRSWRPFTGGAFSPWADDFDVRSIDRYEASADIVMFRDEPKGDAHAFEANAVVNTIRPSVVLPK